MLVGDKCEFRIGWVLGVAVLGFWVLGKGPVLGMQQSR